jgi:hypothetical protein
MSFLDAKRMKELEARVEELHTAVVELSGRHTGLARLLEESGLRSPTPGWFKRKPGRPRKDQAIIGAG